jgi:HK97 family phage major capsid protein
VSKRDEYRKLLLDAREIADRAEQEERDFTAEERQQVENLLEAAVELKKELDKAKEHAALVKQVMDLNAEFEAGLKTKQTPGQPGKGQTIGERFVTSPQFKGWMEQVAPSGHIPESTRGLHSPPVEFESLLRKDLVTGADDESAGAFVETDYTGIYEALGRIPLVLRNLISIRRTTSDLVHFVRQTVQVQEAAPVEEANVTEYSGATGEKSGEKPEGALAFEPVTTPVKTIAVWVPATKRALSDAAQIRGIIDQELRDDLDEEFEDQLLNGDGVGENFTGILNTAGILLQAWDTDLLTTIRRARTTLLVTGRASPTAMICHPNDAETLDLLRDENGRFYFGGPVDGGVQRVWRVPLVECQSMTEGTGLMGDFRKCVVWDREESSIQVSDSHADFFIRNMLAILAEMRAAMGVIRPSAFIEVPFESGS